MATPVVSAEEVERLRKENATLRKRIQTLVAELDRLRKKLESTWGEA